MDKFTRQFRVYPRGFLGIDVNIQAIRTQNTVNNSMKNMQYSVQQNNNSSTVILANPHVEMLYSSTIKNNIEVNSPEFRTKALHVAVEAFGTDNFFIWFTTQYKNHTSGNLHNSFLLDTLRFIKTGVRSMCLENWASLITITDEGDVIGKPGDYAKDFFSVNKDSPIEMARENTDLVDVLQLWCSKPNGLEDLVGTLHILFGNP